MASILRQIVAGPRQKHPEAGLDLCYVTNNIIATSGPSSTFPQRAYRNPTDALVKFLDYKHDTNWAIWEFRAEGTGYPDSEVYGRIRHYPWPDHHPPPFALVPNIMASMREWLKGQDTNPARVVVVHCKAGKGRSGTAACSYLISEEGWTVEDALFRFTTRRMRSGFGAGVSIPSQLRWIRYVDRWTKHQKLYVERQIEVAEVHVWGLRDGVKVAVEGYIDEGRTIKSFHTFNRYERVIVDGKGETPTSLTSPTISASSPSLPITDSTVRAVSQRSASGSLEAGVNAVIFRPAQPIILPTNDISIDLERRNKATYGWTMVTSVAHVWFNAFFEGHGPENHGVAATDGVFEIDWDAMDGIKGSARKGTRALDRLAVVWRTADRPSDGKPELPQIITEPKEGEPVPQTKAADWKSAQHSNLTARGQDLGLRTASPVSANVSKASSLRSGGSSPQHGGEDHLVGVKTRGPSGEDYVSHEGHGEGQPTVTISEPDPGMPKLKSPEPMAQAEGSTKITDVGLGNVASVVGEMRRSPTEESDDGKLGQDREKG
ncbi:MAG: hypothetical protein L6R42_000644 [Xanthoria sp. 1 TBL-2021]|nr:MAG: hypothetical protein L6R42_000644 [Xanthoria sp. 1 TBL-2021]